MHAGLELQLVSGASSPAGGDFSVATANPGQHPLGSSGRRLSPTHSVLLTSSVEQSAETTVCPAAESFRSLKAASVVVGKKHVVDAVVLMNVICTVTQMIKHKCWVDDTPPLQSIAESFGALGGFAIVGAMHVLREAIIEDGSMAALGAGSGGLTVAVIGNKAMLTLTFWDNLIFCIMVAITLFGAA